MQYPPFSRLLLGVGLLLSVAACRSHDGDTPTPTPQPEKPFDSAGVELVSSAEGKDLFQLDTALFTASGTGITDPASVVWYVDGKEVGKGKTLAFTQRLPGSYEVTLRQGKKGLAKSFTVRPRFEEGMLLLSEGNFGNETGVLTYINLRQQFVLDSAYQRVNPGYKLGNVAQDLAFANGKIYVISQNGKSNGGSGLLSVMKQGSLEHLHAFDDAALDKADPTHIAVIGDRIYLRSAQGIHVGSETGGFTLIAGTAGAREVRMVTLGQRLYAIVGTDKILVIQGTQVIGTYTLPSGKLASLAPSDDGQLWIAYTEPSTLAKLSSDPRELKLLATHAVTPDFTLGWTKSPILWAHGSKLYYPATGTGEFGAAPGLKIQEHDFAAGTTKLFYDFAEQNEGDRLKFFYNGLGLDQQGNVYFAGYKGYQHYKENSVAVISGSTQSLLLKRDGVHAFPAGFYPIPAKR